MLTKDQVRAADDRKLTVFAVPEWDGSIYLRALPLTERLDLSRIARGDSDITLDLVVLSACGPDGERLFADDDREWLASKSGEVMQKIALAAMDLNGLRSKATDDAEKN